MSEPSAEALWRRSARCVSDNHCVEVAELSHGGIGLRNSTRPETSLTFSRDTWRDLIAGIKAGDFDTAPR